MKKHYLKLTLIALLAINFSSCDNFFNPSTDVILDAKDYIKEDNEMYAGFLGIITKVQKIGDKSIYITDTRAEMLEPTPRASNELFELYNYAEDLYLTRNSYADPAEYYDVIISCNDYLSRLQAYKESHLYSINMPHYRQLMSGAIRIKAWVYLTLAKIYGEAIWFDDPMNEKKNISDFSVYELKDLISACKKLLKEGVDGVDGSYSFLPYMSGPESAPGFWVSYTVPTSSGETGIYVDWNYMAPEYFVLWSEICLWNSLFSDNPQEDYQEVIDNILPAINNYIAARPQTGGNVPHWLQSTQLWGQGNFLATRTGQSDRQRITILTYDSRYNQTNKLHKHFGNNFNTNLLVPSEVSVERLEDPVFTSLPVGTLDPRRSRVYALSGSSPYVYKYGNGNLPRQDHHIFIYRGIDLYFMLVEALNHLGRYDEAWALINNGVTSNQNFGWEGFSSDWSGSNRCAGVRGRAGLSAYYRPFKRSTDGVSDENTKYNDMQILKETIIEFAVEGKTLPAMVRMALRYNDPDIIADLVCPKYGDRAEEIRTKIHAGGYFIKWKLK